MIIKLQSPLTYARHKAEKTTTVLTRKERINADRIVMAMLFLLTIIGAIIFA